MNKSLVVLLLLVALAVSCRRGDENAAPATATPGVETPQVSLATALQGDCDPPRAHAAGDFNEMVASSGAQRTYILHVPLSYTGSDPLPLVLNLHGYGSNAQQQALYSGFPGKADAEGFILITPQGTGDRAFWNSVGLAALPDDVAFMDQLLDQVEAEFCVDHRRVYSTGISNGAAMSVRLACALSDRIAAIAGVSGVFYPTNCGAARPVSVLAFHGTADAVAAVRRRPR